MDPVTSLTYIMMGYPPQYDIQENPVTYYEGVIPLPTPLDELPLPEEDEYVENNLGQISLYEEDEKLDIFSLQRKDLYEIMSYLRPEDILSLRATSWKIYALVSYFPAFHARVRSKDVFLLPLTEQTPFTYCASSFCRFETYRLYREKNELMGILSDWQRHNTATYRVSTGNCLKRLSMKALFVGASATCTAVGALFGKSIAAWSSAERLDFVSSMI